MEKKQTAVEWLEIELSELECTRDERSLSLHLDLINEAFQEAKKMEREQTYRALAYYFHEHGKLTPNQYCKEIYGGKYE